MSNRVRKASEDRSASRRAAKGWASERPRRGWEAAGICVVLVIVVFIVFGQTVRFGFVNYDDNTNVSGCPQVVAGITPGGIAWAFTHTQEGRWAPVATLSRMIDCQCHGVWPGGHHLTNVLLHALAAVLLFFAVRELTRSSWRSGFVAALFALHPLHVEAVAWVSARGELLSGVFFMLAVWSYAIDARKPGLRRYYALSLLCFLLGLMSKATMVTLPLVLLLLDYWPLGRFERISPSRLVIEKAPFLVLAGCFTVATILVTPETHLADRLPFWLRVENALVSFIIYIRQSLWPGNLAVFYPNPAHAFPLWETLGAAAFICTVSAAAWMTRKRHPELLVGWVWYGVMLLPVIGIVQISNYAHADRYTYLPQIGLCIAATWSAADWAGSRRDRQMWLGGAAVVVLCGCLFAAWRQTGTWRDGETLWRHALGCTADNYIAHNDLGNVLIEQGRAREAADQYAEAVRINPAYADARNNLGHMLFQEGRANEALAQYQEALRLDPGNPQIHDTYGMDLFRMGRVEEAAGQFREAVQAAPAFADGHTCLGNALWAQGKLEEAIAQYLDVLRINPGDALAARNAGRVMIALFRQGRTGEAMGDARQAVALAPANSSLGEALAWMEAAAPQGGR